MNDPLPCPRCGTTLPTDSPEGLCPACLMSGGLGSEAATVGMGDTPKSAPRPFVAPDPKELAAYFPQFEILELLGRGGMGAVYKARQKNLNRLVALKILTIDTSEEGAFAERFQREAQALARLNHPNIVSVYDFGETNGLYYFLMEYVDGANLRTLIRGGEMKPEAALALIPAICDALQFAHDEGIVHRDIKPENVLVDKKGRVKIADFGLAKLLGHEGEDHSLTRTGMTLGTPRYMAPEQMDQPETVDHRADIYSLGVVFYEMLTGEVPMGRFELPSKKVQIDVKFDEIVLHALERDVSLRYQNVSEVKTDVESVAQSTALPRNPIASNLDSSVSAAADQPRLSRMALIGAIWALFGMVAVIPSVLFTKMVDLAEGRPSSLVYEQPPVAFTIFMGVLLFIGMGAPIGTTLFGAISMGNIRRSGGRLYGLPLAFADVVFFPMLLLHGAMAVLLGLLVVTLIKMAGVNAGLGATEMGLLAMLPLIADFFVVRSLWRKVAPVAGSARAWPVERVGKSSRRPIAIGVFSLIAVVAVVFLIRNGSGVLELLTPGTIRISEDPSRIPATRTAGRTDYAYRFTAPPNHRIIVWLEWWKGAQRTIDQDCNTAEVAERGDRVERYLQVIFNDGNVAGPATQGQVRIDWLFDNGGGNSTNGRWRPDFFEGLATSVDLDRVKRWTPKVGETVNLLEIRGGKESIDGNPITEERLRAGRWEAVMILRARVEAVPESVRWEGTATRFNAWNDNEEPSPALLRLGEAFGAVLGPFTDARNLREQIAANLRQDPALRTKAEQMLTAAGLSFTPEEKAEDLLKKLEAIPPPAAAAGSPDSSR